RGI
ncbi:bacterial regulatory helix-turn-helix, lysR family protein, partial [Vibrio parahaemolyticus V-223/04]